MKKTVKQFQKSAKIHWQKIVAGLIWKPETAGEQIQGLVANRQTIETKFGIAPQLEIRDGDTSALLLTSKAGLKLLNRVPLGTPVRVTYTGTKAVKGRKTMMDTFTIETPVGTELEDDWATSFYKKEMSPAKSLKTRARKSR